MTPGSVLQRNPDIRLGEALGWERGEEDWAVWRAAAEKCGDPAGRLRVGRMASGRVSASGFVLSPRPPERWALVLMQLELPP